MADNRIGTQETISDTKRRILYLLKLSGQSSLTDLAKTMKITRMAVHKHLTDLQNRGLVESIQVRKGVGRPTMQYSLTSRSQTIFPKAYGELATYALDYLSDRMGGAAVENVLRERQRSLYERYNSRLVGLNYDQKVKELAKIRDEEGYIAESRKEKGNNSHVLLEHNCPIILVAEKHWEACTVETELFEKVLGAKIETSHRAAKGDSVCTFHIRKELEGI